MRIIQKMSIYTYMVWNIIIKYSPPDLEKLLQFQHDAYNLQIRQCYFLKYMSDTQLLENCILLIILPNPSLPMATQTSWEPLLPLGL